MQEIRYSDLYNFKIIFDKSQYYPGEKINGLVSFSLVNRKLIKKIGITLQGIALCQWNDRGGEPTSNSTNPTNVGEQEFYREEIRFQRRSKWQTKYDRDVLCAGRHRMRFSARLPHDAPSSYMGEFGSINYYAMFNIDDRESEVARTFYSRAFSIISELNFYKFPNLQKPYTEEKSTSFRCCLCCFSTPLVITISLPRTGFAKNETIDISVDVDNGSEVDITTTLSLKRIIALKANNGKNTEIVKDLVKRTLGDVKKHSTQTFLEFVNMPTNKDYPDTEATDIVKIKHVLHIEAKPLGSWYSGELLFTIPIEIRDRVLHIEDYDYNYLNDPSDSFMFEYEKPRRPCKSRYDDEPFGRGRWDRKEVVIDLKSHITSNENDYYKTGVFRPNPNALHAKPNVSHLKPNLKQTNPTVIRSNPIAARPHFNVAHSNPNLQHPKLKVGHTSSNIVHQKANTTCPNPNVDHQKPNPNVAHHDYNMAHPNKSHFKPNIPCPKHNVPTSES